MNRGKRMSEAWRQKLRTAWTPARKASHSARVARDITGRRFGRLVAVKRAGAGPYGCEWECKCECGGMKIVSVACLNSGDVRSCGCLFREWTAQSRLYKRKRPYEYLYNLVVSRARSRGIDCPLSYEEFLVFTEEKTCYYCGETVEWHAVSTAGGRNRTNLDRKDNAGGYEAQNLVVCCWRCNNARGNRYTFGEWQAMGAALRAYRAL